MNGTSFLAFQNRFCWVSQQTSLNNIQPGGSGRRHFSLFAALLLGMAAMCAAPGLIQASSLGSTPSSASYGTVHVGNKDTQTLAIKNLTTSSVTVKSASINHSAFG